MLFAVTCLDKPDHLTVRLANREAHLAYLRAHPQAFRVAGPLLAEDGATPVGSMLVVEAADRDELDRLLADDPYAQAGLFAGVDARPWRWVIGAPA
jgi:uncharacterized protein YciI